MKKLAILSLLFLSSPAGAACNDTLARYQQLTESGEWAAGTANSLDTQARLFGEARSIMIKIQRECGGATERSTRLLQGFDAALESIRQERRMQEEQANDHSLVCVGWEGFMSCN
jgi:hypothetical protein